MSLADNQQIADQWAKGLAGDWAILGTLTAPDMRVWHSNDDVWLDREATAARTAERGPSPQPAFQDVRTQATENGFILQGWIDGLRSVTGRIHIMQVLTVEDGKISAVEEYIAPEMSLDG